MSTHRQPKLRLLIMYLCLLSDFTNSAPPREEHCLMDTDIFHKDACNKFGEKNAPTTSHWLPRKKFLKSVMNLNTKLQKRITTLFPTGKLCKNTMGVNRTLLMLLAPPYHGSTALFTLLMSHPGVATLCRAASYQCEGTKFMFNNVDSGTAQPWNWTWYKAIEGDRVPEWEMQSDFWWMLRWTHERSAPSAEECAFGMKRPACRYLTPHYKSSRGQKCLPGQELAVLYPRDGVDTALECQFRCTLLNGCVAAMFRQAKPQECRLASRCVVLKAPKEKTLQLFLKKPPLRVEELLQTPVEYLDDLDWGSQHTILEALGAWTRIWDLRKPILVEKTPIWFHFAKGFHKVVTSDLRDTWPIRRLRPVYAMMWRPICLATISRSVRHDFNCDVIRTNFVLMRDVGARTRGNLAVEAVIASIAPLLLQETLIMERTISLLHWAKDTPGVNLVLLNYAELIWRPRRVIRSLERLLPCAEKGDFDTSFKPIRGQHIFKGNKFKVSQSLKEFAAINKPRDFGYNAKSRQCDGGIATLLRHGTASCPSFAHINMTNLVAASSAFGTLVNRLESAASKLRNLQNLVFT